MSTSQPGATGFRPFYCLNLILSFEASIQELNYFNNKNVRACLFPSWLRFTGFCGLKQEGTKDIKKNELGLRANGCDSAGGGLLELGSQGPGLLGLGLGNRPGGAEFLSKLKG